MDKNEQVMANVRDLFNKLAWINKVKMEKALEDTNLPKSTVSNILPKMKTLT